MPAESDETTHEVMRAVQTVQGKADDQKGA